MKGTTYPWVHMQCADDEDGVVEVFATLSGSAEVL